MSLFKHVFVLVLIFATSQIAKSAVDPPPLEPDAAKFSFKRNNNGSLSVKISMEKAECVAKAAPTSTVKPGLHGPEAGLKILGDKENPAKSCSEVENSGMAHINTTTGVIKVKCDVDKRTTCLLVKETIEQESLTNTSIALDKELWLSQTTFDVQSLFNKVAGKLGMDIPQIKHFLSTSADVSQTIRYYYSEGDKQNITAEDANVKSLKGLLWNDHLVGSEITKETPMAFTVDGTTKPCWESETEESEKWMCTDIHLKAHSYHNRLPVKDFYIEGIRKSDKVQKLYFELVELCFYDTKDV